MSKTLYVLIEAPTGYALFKRTAGEEIGAGDVGLQRELQSLDAFGRWVRLSSFAPFQSPENALEDCVCVAEGLLSPFLREFLSTALSKQAKKGDSGWELGIADPRLGSAVHEELKLPVVSNESVAELIRCIRIHLEALLPDHHTGDIQRAQCGLGHAFSRNKVKFNVHRSDNMIIQAAALLEHMDKGVNLLGMRVKEWYGWHFPELAKEVPDPAVYAQVVLLIGNRGSLGERNAEEVLSALESLLGDDAAAAARVWEKAATSMGGELAEVDWGNIETFAKRVDSLCTYKQQLQQYLLDKMMLVAPNLTELIGQQIGAKLIAKAGSLTNLAKSPASTIQILGAEKALFRALKKKKGKTPKYGLIFNSTFIQRASKENRGKISRYLANKAAIACRIDCFMDVPPSVFGEKLREQVEARLSFFDTGAKPRPNSEVMGEAIEQYQALLEKKARKAKRRAAEGAEAVEPSKKKVRTA